MITKFLWFMEVKMKQDDYIKKIEGKTEKEVFLYALSTCIWCKKTKEHLKKLGVAYSYINVDELDEKVKNKFTRDLKKWNPSCSYPTVIIDNKECIRGFDPKELEEKLGL